MYAGSSTIASYGIFGIAPRFSVITKKRACVSFLIATAKSLIQSPCDPA